VPDRDDHDTLSLHEAADRLGVHYMTVYRHVRLGRLPAVKEGSTWRVAVGDLDRFRADGDDRGGRRGRGRGRSAPWGERLARRLAVGDEAGAWGVVEAALAGGADPPAVYVEVLVPALRWIGDGWAAGRIDVGVEHRASAIVLRLVGRLGPRFARRGRSRGAVVLGGPAGEQHGLPSALATDLSRGAGFTAVDLGADVPASSFAAVAASTPRLLAVGVSVTTSGNEASVRHLVDVLHGVLDGPVFVGGGAVVDETAARALGGDGWAADALGAIELFEACVRS
jgi:excisionase family DNA binding protein